MNNMFLVNGKVSESPVYWTAKYIDGSVVNQIDEFGKICEKWSTLSIDNLEYWGIISNVGSYGFYLKENICNLNGIKISFEPTLNKKINYKRKILSSSNGWTRTKSVEIGFDNCVLKLMFLPEIKIVFTTQQEITGNKIKDFELKISD